MGVSSLIFDGTLELCDKGGHISSEEYWFEALADGAAWGDPQPVEVALNSLMRDGAITVTTGDDNREATFLVTVCGADSASLDAGVQALHLATRKRTTLAWTPPDGLGEVRVWDVETSNLLEPNGFDDLAYMRRHQQVFRLRLVCLPYRRSAELVIDDAGTPPSSGEVVYDADSVTGWATFATASASFADYDVDTSIVPDGQTSAVRSQSQDLDGAYAGYYTSAVNSDRLTLPTPIDTDAGGYLALPIRTDWNNAIPGSADSGSRLYQLWMTTAEAGEVEVASWVTTGRDSEGYVRYAWPVAAGLTVTALRFSVAQYLLTPFGDRPAVRYGPIELSTAATDEHQIVKQHFVQGSARTTGSLRIAAPSESVPLGQVLAMTVPTYALPAGFQPDGARWATNGTVTPDAGALHGGYYTPNSTYAAGSTFPVFDIPVNMLTAGPYVAVALVKADTLNVSFGVQAQLRIGSTNTGPTSVAEIATTVAATGYNLVPVGTIDLSPLPMQGADETAKVRLLFQGDEFADIFLIPAWQISGQPVADFSIVDCGTGTVSAGGASSSLWIDSPDTAQSEGGWWRGPNPERSMARSAWPDVRWPGVHTFKPGPMTAFVVSLGATGPTSTLEYFPRYL